MKKLLLLLLLILIGCSKPIDSSDLVLRDEKYFIKNTTEPYSGQIVGQIVGKSENGILEGETSYFYDNGNLLKFGNLSKGIHDGEWKFYHDNGNISKIGNFFDGKPLKNWKFFDDEDDLIISLSLDSDGTFTTYYENGSKEITGEISEDLNFDGQWRYFDKNGNLEEEVYWNKGNLSTYKSYFDDGSPSIERYFDLGYKTFHSGNINTYYLRRSVQYQEFGIKIYEYSYWGKGIIKSSIVYDDYGRKKEWTMYDEEGEKIRHYGYTYSDDNKGDYLRNGLLMEDDFKKGKKIYMWYRNGLIVNSKESEL